MVSVKVGDTLIDVKMGDNSKGRWGCAKAKAEKGCDNITVFFTNADNVPSDAVAVTILEIESVELKSRKYNEKWYKDYIVNAKVKGEAGGATPTDLNGLSDDSIPF